MRKIVLAMLWALACTSYVCAQSKVFNEIAGAIRTDFSEIIQNRKVMGYVRLVQLEKADKKTYNYELNIMDENLNEVSTAKFSDGYLSLNEVAFEADVMCATFSKGENNYSGNNSSELYFVSLEGKVLKVQTLENKMTVAGVIRNIPGVGFVYHSKGRNYSLAAFDINGQQIWTRPLAREVYYLAATPKLVTYYDLKDKALSLTDAATGKNTYSKNLQADKNFIHQFTGVQVYGDTVYYSGFVSPYNVNGSGMRYKNLKKGYQKGIVVAKAWAPDNNSIKVTETKWSDGQMACISNRGANPDDKKESYYFTNSVTTKDGNTYLFAENIKRKTSVGKIITTVVTAPFIFMPIYVASTGYNKYYNGNATVFRLSPAQKMTKLIDVEQTPYGRYWAIMVVSPHYVRNIIDEEGLNPYFISGDQQSKMITNLKSKRIKSIPVASGNISSTVFPAKEGHYMLVESNKKAKTAKLSIVPLQ